MSVRTGGGETAVERGQRFEASDGRGGGRERDLRRDEPRRQDQQQHAVQLKMRPRRPVTTCVCELQPLQVNRGEVLYGAPVLAVDACDTLTR